MSSYLHHPQEFHTVVGCLTSSNHSTLKRGSTSLLCTFEMAQLQTPNKYPFLVLQRQWQLKLDLLTACKTPLRSSLNMVIPIQTHLSSNAMISRTNAQDSWTSYICKSLNLR